MVVDRGVVQLGERKILQLRQRRIDVYPSGPEFLQ